MAIMKMRVVASISARTSSRNATGWWASCFLSRRMMKTRAIGSTVNQTANCTNALTQAPSSLP